MFFPAPPIMRSKICKTSEKAKKIIKIELNKIKGRQHIIFQKKKKKSEISEHKNHRFQKLKEVKAIEKQ
jgi:hypothetical protein